MIQLSKSGNTVTFTFDENSGYLQNGTIDVPVNSLSLILDESDMATFRKSASNDIFVSALVGDFGMSKSELEAWYKENMVGSTGGGGGTVSSAITSGDTNAVAGGAVYDQVTIGGGMEVISTVTAASYTSVVMPDCDKFTISASTSIGDTLTSGGSRLYIYNKATEELVLSSVTVSDLDSNYVTIEGTTADTSIALTAVDGYYFKGNSSMMFKSNYSGGWVVTFYKNSDVEWLKDVVSANTATIEGKQDKLIAGDNITISGNVISASGGTTYTAGNGININSANTISSTLPISGGSGQFSAKVGYQNNQANGYGSFATGVYATAQRNSEAAFGHYNASNGGNSTNWNGSSGSTVFSVGNGEGNSHQHNSFEIRQNGDIYIADTNDTSTTNYWEKPMIKLQDKFSTIETTIGDINTLLSQI